MKKGRKVSDGATAVRVMHGMVADSFEKYLGAISVQDLIDAYEEDEPSDLLIARALEEEAARLRAKVK